VAGHALQELPRLSEALASGELGLDNVVEVARFAKAETEGHLIAWAGRVSVGAIRHRGDVWARSEREEVVATERIAGSLGGGSRRNGSSVFTPSSRQPREGSRPGRSSGWGIRCRRCRARRTTGSRRPAGPMRSWRSARPTLPPTGIPTERPSWSMPSSRDSRTAPVVVRSRVVRRSTRTRCAGCSATAGSRRSWRTRRDRCWAWVASLVSLPPGCSGRSVTVTASAVSPRAVRGSSPRRTT
jgi:hypothetical protein